MAVLVGMGIEYDSRVIAFVLLSSLIGVYTVVRTSHGYSLLKTGLIISIANVIVIASTGLIAQINYQELMLEMLLGALSGVLSAVITTGILPYFEWVSNLADSKRNNCEYVMLNEVKHLS